MYPRDICICAHQRRAHRESQSAQMNCSLCYCANFKIAHRAQSRQVKTGEATLRSADRSKPRETL